MWGIELRYSLGEMPPACMWRFKIPGMEFGEGFIRECREGGIRISTVTQYYPMQDSHKDKLLVGYGHLSHVQIRLGFRPCLNSLPKNGYLDRLYVHKCKKPAA